MSTDFAVQQGMLVTGSMTPSEYLKLHQFYDQIPMLTHARSVTARLFTRQEQGQQHCQIGNLGLQFQVIRDWIEIMQQHEEMAK